LRPAWIWTEKVECWPPDEFGHLGSEYEFEKTCDGNGGWSFRASSEKYLSVGDGDLIKASRGKVDAWETFQIEIPESIQGKLDALGPGGTGTIYLKEGVYRGTVNIDELKSVNIIGVGFGRTVVDGDNKGTVITVGRDNSDIDVKLAGMIIRGGLSEHGGGIYNYGRLTLEDADIIGNTATYSGGGVYTYKGSLNIKGSRIVRNRAAHQGGDIINYEGTVNMDSGTIGSNIAAYGGGVLNHLGVMSMSKGDITNNIALGRSRTDPLGEGGGVWNFGTFDFKGGCVTNNQPDDVYHRRISTETAQKPSAMPCCGHNNQSDGVYHGSKTEV
jgi:hypothetical protein